MTGVPDLAAWLRGQIEDTRGYAQENAARRPITPMRSHEMRELAARCEAELAILDEHAPTDWTVYGDRCCRRCKYDDDEPERDEMHHWAVFPCRTVRLLGSGYRGRPGYREEWAP